MGTKSNISKNIAFLVLLLGFSINSYAQYALDALRFSQTYIGGTARNKALGGTNTSLGADVSSIGGNPAGLGFYNRGEISITPVLSNYSTQSTFLGSSLSGEKDQFHFSNLGLVINIPSVRVKGQQEDSGWLSWNVGLNYVKTADYWRDINYSAKNVQGSIADAYADMANTNGMISGTMQGNAYDNSLINYKSSGFFNNVQNKTTQAVNIMSTGSQTEFNIAIGGNYENWLMVGAGLGLVRLYYQSSEEYREQGVVNSVLNASNTVVATNTTYDHLKIQQQTTKGSGVNLKFGVILNPIKYARIGLSIQSPTWFDISDDASLQMKTVFGSSAANQVATSLNNPYLFDYTLRTPSKISAGLTLFAGSHGFVSADVDYLNYSSVYLSGKTSGGGQTLTEDNSYAKQAFKAVKNYRFGAEFKVSAIALRVGYAIQGNPYSGKSDEHFRTETFSGGIGYREKTFFIDFSIQQINFNTDLMPYTSQSVSVPVAYVKNTMTNSLLTVGAFF